jgi:hypothetical protein
MNNHHRDQDQERHYALDNPCYGGDYLYSTSTITQMNMAFI